MSAHIEGRTASAPTETSTTTGTSPGGPRRAGPAWQGTASPAWSRGSEDQSTTTPRRPSVWGDVGAAAEDYERGLVPILFQPWAHDLVDRVGPQPGERVLDVACGTGVVARTAASRLSGAGAVTGVDVNAQMLAVARRAAANAGLSIVWRCADAADTGLPGAAFDVGLCQQGLQFFPDRPAAVRELRRVMAPGGRVAVSVWCDADSPGYAPLPAVFRRHAPQLPGAVSFIRMVFGLDDAKELRDLLTSAGFSEVQTSRREKTVRCASAAQWVRALVRAAPVAGLADLDEPVLEQMTHDVAEALQEYVDADGLAFPVSANVATAVA